jgi:osmoprotectant transport system substrate-binding protein
MAVRHRRVVALLTCLVFVVIAAGCRSSRQADMSGRPPPGNSVVVASFNFPESALLAEIYAQALENAGVPVRRELDLGPREQVLPALHQGLVDVVPEYLGSALSALVPGAHATAAATAAALTQLRDALRPWQVRVLTPAAAQDQNGFAVTDTTARRLSLHTLSDLRGQAARLTLGGPFECRSREYCLPGLERVYGLHFGRFVALDSADQRATALVEGVVDVALIFTTDGRLASGKIVLLDDDRQLQPPENVVPVVSDRAVARFGAKVSETLDAVSAKLTSRSLVFLNWRVGVAHRDPAGEAGGWLRRQGLVPRTG